MKKLPVFYTPRQSADSGAYSPSAAKPAQLVAAWAATGLPHELVEPEPCTEAQLCAAHDARYVRGVLDGTVRNGFGNRRTDVCLSLPWTTGSLLSAARYAIAHPDAPAPCSPTSGFHHAGYDFGGGFCTFGGLMIAARALVAEGRARRVGVLDADMHYGNGTDDVVAHFEREWRAGHEAAHPSAWVRHVTFGADYHRPDQAAGFLRALPGVVAEMAATCDVVLYQAGADPFVEDPLGGWLTMGQLAERDRIVFEVARRAGTPICWNLAGGYTRDPDGGISKVIRIHTNTALEALKAAELADKSGPEHQRDSNRAPTAGGRA